ncbi:hypothetical protein QBC45DRAFT_428647 [Copromyces sp. CBS 386.78]|nr:hypothetical protein QBC45DRAFT_428647 [Copromyces sp. CBS 386.78]
MDDDDTPEIKDIQFGFRRFQAPATRISANRSVFLLDVPPSPIACWLPSWMPQLVRSLLQRLLPEWFLPTTVILKERNPAKADSYENEIAAYQDLQQLQGHCIPRLFGQAAIHDHRQTRYQMSKLPIPGILLEKVEGVPLHNFPAEELGDRLLEQLQETYRLLTEEGVVHGDPNLHNFIRVNNERTVAIDFEFSYPLPSDIRNEHDFETLKDQIERQKKAAEGRKSVYPALSELG